MKLSERKELIREIFLEEEIIEIRAALSDRYDTLTKMAKKEDDHGRRYDDRSWPRERLAILDGDGLRAGVIDVFNPKSAETKNGELFEDEDDDDDLEEVSISSMVNRPNSITPEYENTPDICPHTEILDETEEGEAPRFRCTLCGEEIRALGAPAGDDEDSETIEADFEIVDESTPLGTTATGRDAYVAADFVREKLVSAFPDEDPLPSVETISDYWPMPTRWEVIDYTYGVVAGDVPPMPEVLKAYLAPEELHAAAEGPPPPTLEELDALTLEELGVPTRARNVLARRGIKTAADYLAAGDAVLRIPRVGDITLTEINQALRDRGLSESAARQIEAQLVAQGRALVGAMGGGETADVEELEETPEDVQTSEDTLPWEQVGLALGNGKPAEPEEIIVLDAMEWPDGPPMIGQRIHDLRYGKNREAVIGAVSERFVTMAHPETGRPTGSLRVEDVRWSPTLGCWAWGAPAAAGV